MGSVKTSKSQNSLMLVLDHIIGSVSDSTFADELHKLQHENRVEYLEVGQRDIRRRRFRAKTDRGSDCAVVLDRTQRLSNGDLLLLELGRAIIVRVGDEQWLRIVPHTAEAALRIGYHCGNLHWRVRFCGKDLLVLVEGRRTDYMARLEKFISDDEITVNDGS